MERRNQPLIVRTARLVIRPWQRADLDQMADWPRFPDPLDDGWNWPQRLREHGSADLFFIGHTSDPARRDWTIFTDDQPIGYLCIREFERRSARLGIHFGYPYVGQGYGSEALQAFLTTFFDDLAFNEMKLDVRAYNVRARRLYERLGFDAVRRVWQVAGPIEAFSFLAAPQYDLIRQHFRPGTHTMSVESIEMTLGANTWRERTAQRS